MRLTFIWMTVILLAASNSALSNTLKGVTVSESTMPGTTVEVTVAFNEPPEQISCGLVIAWGDGDVQKLRVGQDQQLKPPFKIQHTYKNPGQFSPIFSGELMIRGLRSVSGCEGRLSAVVNVGPRGQPSSLTAGDGGPASPQASLDQGVAKPVAEEQQSARANVTSQSTPPAGILGALNQLTSSIEQGVGDQGRPNQATPSVGQAAIRQPSAAPSTSSGSDPFAIAKASKSGVYPCNQILNVIIPIMSGSRQLHPVVAGEVTATTESELLNYIEGRKNKVCSAESRGNAFETIGGSIVRGYEGDSIYLGLADAAVSCFISGQEIEAGRMNQGALRERAKARCKETSAQDWINFENSKGQKIGRERYAVFEPVLKSNLAKIAAKEKSDERFANYDKAAAQDRDLDVKGFRIGDPLQRFTTDNSYSCTSHTSEIAECVIKYDTTCRKGLSQGMSELYHSNKARIIAENIPECSYQPSQPNSPWATIAGVPIDSRGVQFWFLSGKLIHLMLTINSDSSPVFSALKEKYGPPPNEKQAVWPAKGKLLKIERTQGTSRHIILTNENAAEEWKTRLSDARKAQGKATLQERERKQAEDIRLRAKDL